MADGSENNSDETKDGGFEVFDFDVVAVAHPIELFELNLPRPPQGTGKKRFDIRADVRFAYVDLELDGITVRIAVRGAKLISECVGCFLLPHSLYGSNPLPSRNVVAVEEKRSEQIGASVAAETQAKIGLLQGFDASGNINGKASAGIDSRVDRQGRREESVLRVTARPHGIWELSEPDRSDNCLEGDYLTSRGHYLESPSTDPADRALATVESNDGCDEISVALAIEIQTRDIFKS